jgi:hypothetical protein
MLDKKRGYAFHRPFYTVDTSVNIQSGMVAFLGTDNAGNPIATTASSAATAMTPIGTFWKDAAVQYVRSWVEEGTFNANDVIFLSKGNIHSASEIKVTNLDGSVTFTQSVNYSATLANGVITRMAGISAGATLVIWYTYNVLAGKEFWENSATKDSTGSNYDRQANDTLGSGKITVVEGDATLFTDQYDVNQTYILNAELRSDINSKWTTASGGGTSSVCGIVRKVPTASDPFLGLAQVRVTS